MNKEQIQLIRQSWEQVKPIQEIAGNLFYQRLFELAPQVRHLFKSGIKTQAAKLMATLGLVVAHLDKPDILIPKVTSLAQRHNQYGAQPAHYAVVGEALLCTLEQGLGDQWNDDLKEAWATAFGVLAKAMIEAQEASKAVAAQ